MMVFGVILAAIVGTSPVAAHGSVAITTRDANQWAGVSISVSAWDQPRVEVEQEVVHGDASQFGAIVTHEGGTTRITADYRGPRTSTFFGLMKWGSGARVRWIVHVPANAPLVVESSNGEIQVDGVTAPIDAHTSNGAITIANAGPRVTAHSSNGEVEVRLGATAGVPQIDMHSSNGGLKLFVPRGFGARIDAHTSNGNISNPFTSATGAGSVVLRTSNGNIDVVVNP